jgi:Ser/Thr protein kinase RdoA (MazF antagonist)
VFGLAHADLHPRNIFVDGKSLRVFDFDDLQFHWFAYDLAVPLAWVQTYWTCATADLRKDLLYGYRDEHEITDEWVERLTGFVYVRLSLDLELAVRRQRKFGNLSQLSDRVLRLCRAMASVDIGP